MPDDVLRRRTSTVVLPSSRTPGFQPKIFVDLCLPPGPDVPDTVLLLVAGGSYNRTYWDLPDVSGGTDRYSFVSAATAAGYATLAVDTLGRGNSSRPASALCTLATDAWICDQLTDRLRSAAIEGPDGPVAFEKVVAVGHSWGTATIWVQATDYQGLDGVVLTGNAHRLGDGVPEFVPAKSQTLFASSDLDDGYITTPVGGRAVFYEPGKYDPALLDWDERHKDLWSGVNIQEVADLLVKPLDIRVPAFLVVGKEDQAVCSGDAAAQAVSADAFVGAEGPSLGLRVPSVEAFVLPDAGHSINGALNANEWYSAAARWLDSHIGGAAPM